MSTPVYAWNESPCSSSVRCVYRLDMFTPVKSWIFRFMLNGKEREMGLGSRVAVNLVDARQKRDDYRKLVRTRIDPIEARKRAQLNEAVAQARSITFTDAATAYIDGHRTSWKNAKHAEQWTNTIATYCGPVFGGLPVHQIDTELVLKAIEAIWTTKPETADRLRGRIERILDWATSPALPRRRKSCALARLLRQASAEAGKT